MNRRNARRYVYYVVYSYSAFGALANGSVDVILDKPITTMEQVNEMHDSLVRNNPARGQVCITHWILLREEAATDE